jgi:hypothetical protein
MTIDRTAEFYAAVSSISSRTAKSLGESRRLLSSNYYNNNDNNIDTTRQRLSPKSEFSKMASKIGHDINSTGAKLQKLTQCDILSEKDC